MSTNEGRVVLVTGAAGGVGRATAQKLLRQGARVAVIDSNEALLDQALADFGAGESQLVSVVGDICDGDVLSRFVDKAQRAFGGIDAVCNVAGILGPGPLEAATVESFDRIMHANCLSQLLLVQRALPALRESGHASIVNVASVGATAALPMMSIYCASKAAVLGLTRAMALELAPAIRCNAVCPGGIDSPMSQALLAALSEAEREALLPKLIGRQMIKRFAMPEEVANMITYLISDEASFMTGAILPVDGGHGAW